MVSKIAILAAVVMAVSIGSTVSASARHGGMMGPGGFTHSGFSHGFAFRHDRDDRFHFRHRFFREGFVFAGAPYDYDDCYTRVWTRWGWRVRSLCY
jgi:hypothetical protein